MSRQLEKISLSQIRLETNFRNKEKDLSLELDINRNGLRIPLAVEKESKDEYVLVDGYRRFYALEFLKKADAECFVEGLSSEEGRIIKRLDMELHTKKKTAYQLGRMVQWLLQNKNYDKKRIASLCNVTPSTIAKYIRGSDVNPDWLKRGEKAGVGVHAFTTIHELSVSKDNKNYIAEKYINKEITKDDVDHIKKAVNDKAFKNIPQENIIECVDQIIERRSQEKEAIKEVVGENSLMSRYTKGNHFLMHNIIIKLLTRVERILSNNHYTDHVSESQKNQLTKKVRRLNQLLNPPIQWRAFPNEDNKRTVKFRKPRKK